MFFFFNRLPYRDPTVPVTLQEFLSQTSECFCRRPTFSSMPSNVIPLSHNLIRRISVSICPSSKEPVIKFNFCSHVCFIRYYSFSNLVDHILLNRYGVN